MTPTACALTTVPLLLFLSPLTGRAQELITDRPDFTESAVVVPAGSIQIEGGLTWVDDGGSQGTLSGPEILLRWGLGDRFELRIGLPDYVEPRRGPSGVGDASIGVKWQLGPTVQPAQSYCRRFRERPYRGQADEP